MRSKLQRGEYGPAGTQLPPISELSEAFGGAARGTVAKVLSRLAADGLVEVVPGWGSFVKQDVQR